MTRFTCLHNSNMLRASHQPHKSMLWKRSRHLATPGRACREKKKHQIAEVLHCNRGQLPSTKEMHRALCCFQVAAEQNVLETGACKMCRSRYNGTPHLCRTLKEPSHLFPAVLDRTQCNVWQARGAHQIHACLGCYPEAKLVQRRGMPWHMPALEYRCHTSISHSLHYLAQEWLYGTGELAEKLAKGTARLSGR
jgi:hypothetical protein